VTDDRRPGAEPGERRWSAVLDELSARLVAYRQAFAGAGPFPGPYAAPEGLGPLPAALAGRAEMIHAAQGDVEQQLRARLGALGSLMRRSEQRGPALLDRRA
jgi:hypothetical protein